MKTLFNALLLSILWISTSCFAIEVPSGRLTTLEVNHCDSAICEPCYFIEPSLEHACSDDFGAVDFTDFRTSLGLTDFNEECTRHDSCYHVIGNTKAQCDSDFGDKLYDACEDTYIRNVPSDILDLISSADPVKRAARLVVLGAYNDLLSGATGIAPPSVSAFGFSFDPTNPLEGTPLEDVSDGAGDVIDDIEDVVTNPLDGTILDDEKFDQLGNELANLEDSIRDLFNGLNLAKYYMCTATADIMVTAVAAGPGSLTGFDKYQRDAISLIDEQLNDHSCSIEDVQIVDTADRHSASSIITGLYGAYNLNVGAVQLESYLSIWDVYGKSVFSGASKDADRTHKAVMLIPVLSVINSK
jgi:hypothetical protein